MTTTETNKYVYNFTEGKKELKNLLGGKGANLGEMTNLGLNIPPGFTITTEACLLYFQNPKKIMTDIEPLVIEKLKELEKITGKKFGDKHNPLLVSVRSGAPMSMPGMMDTVLNLGLNDESVKGMAEQTENPRFAYDSWRRFIQMFGDVCMGIGDEKFERILDKSKRDISISAQDTDLSVADLQKVIADYKALYEKEIGTPFPQDPYKQLFIAIEAVFKSWNNKRAVIYRKLNDIPDFGTA
ncbi:MAG: PEP/pyruvate-binding domain-containing protein, partial [Promethearchaeota archaeon]